LGASPSTVEPGDVIEYTITATNNGQADATNVQVLDELPADLTSATSTGVNCASPPPQTICKKFGSLPAGESVTFTITGTVNGASQASVGFFENQASSTYGGPFGTQRSISESVSIKYGTLVTDLATAVAFSKDYVQAGQNATLTASITNLGPTSDPDPVLTLSARSGAKLSLVTMPAGCSTISATSVTCNASALGVSKADPLNSGETARIRITVKPARTNSWLTVWARSKTSLAVSDANSSNDTSMARLYVNHKPRAKIAKTSAIAGGRAVTFSLASKISDQDGDSLGVTLGKVKYGSARIVGDVVTFTPPKNWDGKFSIPYTVRDGKGGLAKSLIAVTVQPKPTSKPTSKPTVDPPARPCFRTGC
jgi:uncharacterized repeat protein (TIGR01451 family)